MPFNTPILFIVFNRPDTTKIVFDQIKKIRPKKLFIAADGPRIGISDDLINCARVREIFKGIDWDCQIFTLFRDRNLGCGKSVSSAISWFFENVEEGIIIEDDCVPDLSFFNFCTNLLERYRLDHRVMMISGNSYSYHKIKYPYDFYFSLFYNIWGWATWKRAWALYDFELNLWKKERSKNIQHLNRILRGEHEIINFWINNFDLISQNKIDTWDFQWCYACLLNEGLSANSINNLIFNIGNFGAHSKGDGPFFRMPVRPINSDCIKCPPTLSVDRYLDNIAYKNLGILKPWHSDLFLIRLFKKILRLSN